MDDEIIQNIFCPKKPEANELGNNDSEVSHVDLAIDF